MDYAALGLAAILAIALIVAILCWRSASNARDDLAAQLIASVRDAAQKAVDGQTSAFELAQCKNALASSTARADALQEAIAHDAKTTDPGANLAPDDVAGRVLRLSQRWADSVPGVGSGPGPAGK